MYYPCSENKDADQLRGHREADLRLCFRLCKLLVFSCTGSCTIRVAKTKAMIRCAVTAQLVCVFVFAYAKSCFSHEVVKMTSLLNTRHFKFHRNLCISAFNKAIN